MPDGALDSLRVLGFAYGMAGPCIGRFAAFDPPLSTTNACTSFASISVPLRQTARGLRSGTATLKLTASPSNDPVTGKKRPKDTDPLTLVCKPRP
jgi:hypothetical protein